MGSQKNTALLSITWGYNSVRRITQTSTHWLAFLISWCQMYFGIWKLFIFYENANIFCTGTLIQANTRNYKVRVIRKSELEFQQQILDTLLEAIWILWIPRKVGPFSFPLCVGTCSISYVVFLVMCSLQWLLDTYCRTILPIDSNYPQGSSPRRFR